MRTAVLFLLFPILALGDSGKTFTYSQLLDLINKNDVRSIEQLLPLIPREFRESFTLVYDSKSIQGADRKNPRAIVFGRDAKLVLTFNGDPKQKGYNNLEILHWDEQNKKFELREITFSDDKQKPHFSEANPNRCMQCHAANPKPFGQPMPIMQQYFRWEGFYGSNDDQILKIEPGEKSTKIRVIGQEEFLAQEGKDFSEFRKNAAKNPRYRTLYEGHEKEQYFPYYLSNGKDISFKFSLAPNVRLTNLLYVKQMKNLIQRIQKSEAFARYKNILGVSFTCGQNLPKDFYKRVATRILEERRKLSEVGILPDEQLLLEMAKNDGDRTSQESYEILNALGVIGLDEWQIIGTKKRQYFIGQPTIYTYATGIPSTTARETLSGAIQDKLPGAENCLNVGFGLEGQYPSEEPIGKDFLKFVSEIRNRNCSHACETFKAGAEKELTRPSWLIDDYCGNDKSKDLPPSFFENLTARIKDEARKPWERCMDCHSQKDPNLRVGPYIPFHNTKELRGFLNDSLEFDIDNFTSQSSDKFEGNVMPRGQRPLTEAERKLLFEYLEKAKKH